MKPPGWFVRFLLSAVLCAGPFAAPPAGAERLQPEDLDWRGAFLFPAGDEWTYGGHALAHYPAGDPAGDADGYPGSLFAAGHAWYRLVGELSIPAPVASRDPDDLPRAGVLTPQSDITEGMLDDCVYYDSAGVRQDCLYREVAGLAWLPEIDKIAWNLRDWYNVAGYDLDSLGWSALNLTGASGVWHIGERFNPEFHNGKTCNYLFRAPASFADLHLGGRRLLAGNHRGFGAFGGAQGPSLYALAPWTAGDPPDPRAEIDALALIYYPTSNECIDDPRNCLYPGYRIEDSWGGGAWVEAGERSAVLIFGRKGLGLNFYGPGRPGDCSSAKGTHSDPYEPQILFYDPEEIAEAAAGDREPWEVLPYATHSPSAQVYNRECGEFIAVAHDADRGIVYAVEGDAFSGGRMAVHVWGIRDDPGGGGETRVMSSEW